LEITQLLEQRTLMAFNRVESSLVVCTGRSRATGRLCRSR
jgi:hypothetical protein